MSEYGVIQGTTGPTIEVYAAEMVSTTGWTCAMTLRAPNGDPVIERQITETNDGSDRFVAFITEAETAALDVDVYTWEFSLTNTDLHPHWSARELHTVCIEPELANRTALELERGENSFCDYATLIDHLQQLPHLHGANSVSRVKLKAAAAEAWMDVGALYVDLGKGLPSSRYLTASALDALSDQHQKLLIQAQLVQADYILTTPETVRDANIRQNAVGESVMTFRNNRRVIVCPKAVEILRPLLVPGWQHSARIVV